MERLCVFFNGDGFSSKGSLFHLQLSGLSKSQVCRYNLPGFKEHHITRDELRRRDIFRHSVSYDRCRRGCHFFKGGHGLFCPVFLGESKDGVKNDDYRYGDGI